MRTLAVPDGVMDEVMDEVVDEVRVRNFLVEGKA